MSDGREPLAEAEAGFAEWRKGKLRRNERIPESLWDLAVAAVRSEGPWRVCRALRLDYRALKNRAESSGSIKGGDLSPSFVEFSGVPFSRPGSECVVKLEDGRGCRLRLELTGSATSELVGLLRSLWVSGR